MVLLPIDSFHMFFIIIMIFFYQHVTLLYFLSINPLEISDKKSMTCKMGGKKYVSLEDDKDFLSGLHQPGNRLAHGHKH